MMNEIEMMNVLTPNQYLLLRFFEIRGNKSWDKVFGTIGMSKNTYYKCRNVLEERGLI